MEPIRYKIIFMIRGESGNGRSMIRGESGNGTLNILSAVYQI